MGGGVSQVMEHWWFTPQATNPLPHALFDFDKSKVKCSSQRTHTADGSQTTSSLLARSSCSGRGGKCPGSDGALTPGHG